MANLWAAIALPQLSRLDRMIAGRIRVAREFHEELSRAPGIDFPQYAQGRYLSRIVLALPAGTDLVPLRSALLERGVATRRAYATPDAVIRDAPNAAAITKRLLEVPSRSTMKRSEVRAICGAVAQCPSAINRRS